MFSRKTAMALLLGSLMLTHAGVAFAQLDEADFKTRMAQAAGMSKKDLSEALRQYLEIRAVYGGPEIDYSLGRTYQKLYQCEQAQFYYTQIMVAYDLPPGHPVYSRAIADYDKIASCDSWQKVRLSCTLSEGDTVSIGDSTFTECWNRPFSLPDGKHVIKITGRDGREKSVEFIAVSGASDETIELALPVEAEQIPPSVESCAGFIPEPKNVVYREKFHPALYWSLIAGGALFLGGSGWFSAMANNALVDVQKFEDMYAIDAKDETKKKAADARDKVNLGNTLMYASLGVGGALAVTGIVLAIVSAISPKEAIETDANVSAFVTPSRDGAFFGLGVDF